MSSELTLLKVADLPLFYKHPERPGTLVFSFDVNDKGPIKGYYIFAVQLDNGDILEKGAVKGIRNLDKIRNEFIFQGWRRYLKPKVEVKDPAKKKEKKKEEVVEHVDPPPNEAQDKAREAAYKFIRDKVWNDNSFF